MAAETVLEWDARGDWRRGDRVGDRWTWMKAVGWQSNSRGGCDCRDTLFSFHPEGVKLPTKQALAAILDLAQWKGASDSFI